jgi:hypothetical protein
MIDLVRLLLAWFSLVRAAVPALESGWPLLDDAGACAHGLAWIATVVVLSVRARR